MPKKTKKEKMLADYRRNSSREELSDSSSAQPSQKNVAQQVKLDGSYRFTTKTMYPTPAVTSFETNELHAIRKDVFKTLVLSAIALTGELILYWHWELKP